MANLQTTQNRTHKQQQPSDSEPNKKRKLMNKGFAKIALSFALATSVLAAPNFAAEAEATAVNVPYVKYHVVKKGDTMYSIARKHGMVVERLMDANYKLNPTIYVGQRIGIPAKDWPWDGRIDAPGEKYTSPYFVGSGDTLYSIAKKVGTTVPKLKKMNGLKSNYIQVGQKLKISGKNVEK